MTIGLVGQKCGMTRMFLENGMSIPVTVIEVKPNKITQVKTNEVDGYSAVQISKGSKKLSRVTKPMIGHYAKAKVEPGDGLWEFRLDDVSRVYKVGEILTVALLKDTKKVDIAGISKGKGFAGTVKRHNFATQDATHGNSLSHRAPGSIGQNQSPGRVFKGKKMSGHMGNIRTTIQSLELIGVDEERNLLLVKGSVPGAKGGHLIVQASVKQRLKKEEVAE